MKKNYETMSREEKVNFLKGQIDFGDRMQGGFAYPYKSPIVPYMSTWFEKEYGKHETDWIKTLSSLAISYGIETSTVLQLVKYDLKSEEWNKLIEQYDLVSNSSKIIKLLSDSCSIIKNLPIPEWNNNSKNLTERINEVKLKILNGTYNYKSFNFSDFNTKSTEGELWEYYRGLSIELHDVFIQLTILIEEENIAQH